MKFEDDADRRGATRTGPAGPGLPTFLVIGAMRSGTTSLAHALRAHPEVFVPRQKELHFFDWNWERGVAWYRERLAPGAGRAAVGEATPMYMYYPDALDRMAETVPDARLIAILRNPVDRAYSHYWFNRSLRIEDRPFAEALAREPTAVPPGSERHNVMYVDMGRYVLQLRAVCNRFPRESLHVVLFDEFMERPEEIFRDVCRFLGVAGAVAPGFSDVTSNGYAEYRSRVLQKVAWWAPPAVRRAIRRLNRRTVSYPRMDDGIRRELAARLAADVDELGTWLGRDLSMWTDS